jgi:hypothetical protein
MAPSGRASNTFEEGNEELEDPAGDEGDILISSQPKYQDWFD